MTGVRGAPTVISSALSTVVPDDLQVYSGAKGTRGFGSLKRLYVVAPNIFHDFPDRR